MTPPKAQVRRAVRGKPCFLGRLRVRRLRLDSVFSNSPISRRWRIAGWIGASFALVAVLGTLQFLWIGQVSEFQEAAYQSTLRKPMVGTMKQFQNEVQILLRTFTPGIDKDPSDRLRIYRERFLFWHSISQHGPLIRRMLFYDVPLDGHRELTELLTESPAMKHTAWGEDLAHVRRHLEGWDLEPDRSINKRWAVTWMIHPGEMAIFRPIITADPGGFDQFRNPRLSGFFILQLNPGFIRNRLIPAILADQFRLMNRSFPYTVSILIRNCKGGGCNNLVYDPQFGIEGRWVGSRAQFSGYSLRPLDLTGRPHRIGLPDYNIAFPLSTERVNKPMKERGAVQRVMLRSKAEIFESRAPNRIVARAESDQIRLGESRIDNPGPARVWSSDRPRLVLIADAPYSLYLRTKRVGVSEAENVNLRYKRSVAMGLVVLVLLVGSLAMAARSEKNAAYLAAMRVDAAVSQSHQLRNPLAGISLLADNMVQGALGHGEKAIEYGKKIQASGRRLNELVNRTVRLAAMDSPAGSPSLSMTDVSEIARDAFERERAMIEGAGFTAECSCPEGLPAVQADAEALRLSVCDLLGNAVKYGLPGRWVRIETDQTGRTQSREVRIRIFDRGPGISARDAQMVFEPFYRAPDVVSSSIPGSGLGLTLARNAIEGMGGRLTLVSDPGRGSVFTISFPVTGPH